MPNNSEPPADIVQIRDVIASRFGFYFSETRLSELTRKLKSTAKKAGFSDLAALSTALLANVLSDEHQQALIHSLAVGETYFFREFEAVEALGHTIIPALCHEGKNRLRIWSAGCATGEEPYSIAMFLLSTIPDINKRNISILATDINFAFLDKAKEALYTHWSFRAMPKRYRSLFFRDVADNRSELLPSVRDMVTFRYLNLVEDFHPDHANRMQEMDVIFCRNVLMYFEPAIIQSIIGRFARTLVPDGWLVVSQTECCDYFNDDFDAVQCGGITIYRRKGAHSISDVKTGAKNQPSWLKPCEMGHTDMHAAFAAKKPLPKLGHPDKKQHLVTPSADISADLLLQARQLADAGHLDEACAKCEELVVAESLNFDVQMLHATILQEAQRFIEARAALRKVLYLKPDFVMGYYSLGIIEQKLGNRREALRYFDTAARMLTAYQDSTVLPEVEGLTAGRLKEFLDTARKQY